MITARIIGGHHVHSKRVGILADFETRSPVDLKVHGASRYSRDLRTEVMCLCVADVYARIDDRGFVVDRSDKRLWLFDKPSDKAPFIPKEDEVVFAYNAEFEYLIYTQCWGVELRPSQMYCIQVQGLYSGLPAGLDKLSNAAAFTVVKDKEGHDLMVKMSKQREDGTYLYDHEKMERLCTYCIADIECEAEALEKLRPLPPYELRCYQETLAINITGIPVDTELVLSAREMNEVVGAELKAMYPDINLKSHAQIKAFAKNFGYTLVSTDKEHVADALDDPALPGPVKDLLEIKAMGVGSSSVSKFDALVNFTDDDGYLRGSYRHHGAIRTGRWTSQGVQIQNLPRGEKAQLKVIAELRELIRARDVDGLYLKSGMRPMDALRTSIRTMFAAPKGWVFVQRDLAAIEARGAFWVAMARNLQMFHDFDAGRGEEPYMIFANKLGMDRFAGKQGLLSCVAEGTPVLTSVGWVKIEDITAEHRVFDGVEFVPCEGAIDMGKKPVACDYWLPFTADHKILTEENIWEEIKDLNMKTLQSALSLASSQLLAMLKGQRVVSTNYNVDALAELRLQLTSAMSLLGEPLGATNVEVKNLISLSQNTTTYSQTEDLGVSGLSGLLPFTADATTLETQCSTDTEEEVLRLVSRAVEISCHTYERLTTTKIRHLNSTESTMMVTTLLEILDSLLEHSRQTTLKRIKKSNTKVGCTHQPSFTGSSHRSTLVLPQFIKKSLLACLLKKLLLNSTELKITGSNTKVSRIGSRSSGECSLRGSRMQGSSCHATEEVLQQMKLFVKVKRTLDVKNAGPRHRFMVMTGLGPMIVHNCNYGIGVKTLVALCATQGRSLTEAEGTGIWDLHKQMFPEVKEMWKLIDDAAKGAIETPGIVTLVNTPTNPIKFLHDGKNLMLRLPSERVLTYWGARLEPGNYGKEITYMTYGAEDKKAQGWHKTRTWGGAIFGHCVQAFSACIMRDISLRLREAGIPACMLIHDECVCLVREEDAQKTFDKMTEIMNMTPAWAKGLPVKSAGWIGNFFVKD